MTTTRERVLEAACREFWQAHEPQYVSAMADDTERTAYDEAADAARAALALPPSPDVNADMLAALQQIASLCAIGQEFSGAAQSAMNVAKAAIARATGREG